MQQCVNEPDPEPDGGGGVNVIFFWGGWEEVVTYKKKCTHVMYMQKHTLLTHTPPAG